MRHTCQRRIFFNTLAKALFLATLGALSYAHAFNDLYTGTVTLEDKELGTKGYKLTVEVIGGYEEKGGKNYLTVDSFGNITPNKSCHLVD